MNLSANDLLLLCKQAITAATKAGNIISNQTGQSIKVETKKGGESLASQVVTQVDYSSQAAILEILNPTCESFDLALLSEESPDDLKRLEKDYFWCIDPLDGTLSFIESIPGYAVSIALVARDGTSCIGVIYDPVKQTLYHAIKGGGAFRNGTPWTLKSSSVSADKTLTLITDKSFKQHAQVSEIVAELETMSAKMGYEGINLIQQGGAVMNACWVIEKSPACYFKFPKSENGGGCLWDYAATVCLFNEMGAIASDIYGKPLELNSSGSTFFNHCGVLFATHREIAGHIMNLNYK